MIETTVKNLTEGEILRELELVKPIQDQLPLNIHIVQFSRYSDGRYATISELALARIHIRETSTFFRQSLKNLESLLCKTLRWLVHNHQLA